MNNPWSEVPLFPPYVLHDEGSIVERANSQQRDWRFQYQLQLLPDPYTGDLNAPVIIFTLNPGYTEPKVGDDNFNDDWWHENSIDLKHAYRRNFLQEPTQYPFFFLNPIFANNPGGKYWTKRLADLICVCGREEVAKSIVAIEFFPYHSKKFNGRCRVPSQAFAQYQIHRAIERNALIIIVRAERALLKAVPELKDYPYLTVKSPMSGYLSRGNVEKFEQIVKTVKSTTKQA